MEAESPLSITLGIFLLRSCSGILCVMQDTTLLWKTSSVPLWRTQIYISLCENSMIQASRGARAHEGGEKYGSVTLSCKAMG